MRTELGRACDVPRCPHLAILTVGLVLANVNEARELCASHAREALDMADELGVAPRVSRICEYGVVLDFDDAMAEIERAERSPAGASLLLTVGELLDEFPGDESRERARQATIDWLEQTPGGCGDQLAKLLGVNKRRATAILGNLKRYGLAERHGAPGHYKLTRQGRALVTAAGAVGGAA